MVRTKRAEARRLAIVVRASKHADMGGAPWLVAKRSFGSLLRWRSGFARVFIQARRAITMSRSWRACSACYLAAMTLQGAPQFGPSQSKPNLHFSEYVRRYLPPAADVLAAPFWGGRFFYSTRDIQSASRLNRFDECP